MATTSDELAAMLREIKDQNVAIKALLEEKIPRMVELENEIDRLNARWEDSEPAKLDQEIRRQRREITRLQEQIVDMNRAVFGDRGT